MAKRTSKNVGPQFVQYFGPVIEALKELGGSGRPTEVKDLIVGLLEISEDEQSEQIESGASRFSKNVDWARFYLAKAGYIGSSNRGVWSLTEKGYEATITREDALNIFQQVHSKFKSTDGKPDTSQPLVTQNDAVEEVEMVDTIGHRARYHEKLLSLSPTGFERFCQRLLREAGFQDLEITGRSGDGGLDGHGGLQINDFVSFQVYFQCKRYSGAVSASVIRDFRGAMMGRADKGIILTTGTFTRQARQEATRDGATPIELVDSEKILDMVEKYELGVSPETIYVIDESFFDEFDDPGQGK